MAEVSIPLPYGREGTLDLRLPAESLIRVIRPRPVEPVPDEYQAIRSALQTPEGSPALEKIPLAGKKIAMVVDDITRPTPTRKALVSLLDYLREAGADEKAITFVFASRSHRAHTPEEHRYRVGEDVARCYRLVDHEATGKSSLVDLGVSTSGLPIILNRGMAKAAARLWCRKAASLEEAVRAAGIGNGAGKRVVVLPEAPYTIAELRAE